MQITAGNSPNRESSVRDSTFLIRALDVIGACLGLLLLAPVFLVISFVVRMTSEGPVLYKAERIGRSGQPFKLFKFRTMYANADRVGPGITLKDDPRITPVGHFLRQAKLDEIPQLLNVIKGDMSLVGPRPEDPRYVETYTPTQRQILETRPGITSPASIQYRHEEDLLDGDNWERTYRERILPRKLATDLAYLQQRTVWTDLRVILETAGRLIVSGAIIEKILTIRNRHLFVLDLVAFAFVPSIALSLHLDQMAWQPEIRTSLILFSAAAVLVKVPIYWKMQIYNRYWRSADLADVFRVVMAASLSTVLLLFVSLADYVIGSQGNVAVYITIPVLDWVLTLLATGGTRLSVQFLDAHHRRQNAVGGRRVLIVGAGNTGRMVAREMHKHLRLKMEPLAFADDDPFKQNTHIDSLPVAGTIADIPRLVEEHRIQHIVLAMPSAQLRRRQEILTICNKTGIPCHNIPGTFELLQKTVSNLPQVDIDQILQREPLEVRTDLLAGYYSGETVLVTGAGGSIGSELCRQIARLNPAQIVLLGHGENSVFEAALDLRLAFPSLETRQVIADIRDQDRMNWVMKEYQPTIVLHAAAHKHVPLMQMADNIEDALTNNVLGTITVLKAAERYGVDHFVMISTDKAVYPTSIMGMTKRLAELAVCSIAQRSGRAYQIVRFGNVLGSRGSVVPVFQQQIASGGPVTITHPDMRRYMMTIPEAAQLVLHASTLGSGGEIFVLDMGEPIKIVDLAKSLIKFSGLKPYQDIAIEFTGIRPGEKLDEELFLSYENPIRTEHPRIFKTECEFALEADLMERLTFELISLSRRLGARRALAHMPVMLSDICRLIDDYQPPGYAAALPGIVKPHARLEASVASQAR